MFNIAPKTFPTLYKLSENGAVIEWTIQVQGRYISTKWGQQGGQFQATTEVIDEGKNIGKKNATTPEQQALKEAEAKWTKQQKKMRYVLTPDAALAGERSELVKGGYDCMTAYGIDKKPKALKYPCAVQRKYDGHRVLAVVEDGHCTLWSRSRQPITGVPHINRALETVFPTGQHFIDGEGYTMEVTFEEISSYLRSTEPLPGHEIIDYHIYDANIDGAVFKARWEFLQAKLTAAVRPLVLAPTYIAKNREEVDVYKEKFLEAGYEGAMARNLDGLYVGKRSSDLLKLKLFEDDEFEVVAVTTDTREVQTSEGVQKKYYPQFTCKLPGKLSPAGAEGTFNTTINAPQPMQAEYSEHRELYIGQLLTVRYQNYTSEKKPRIPKGIRFKEDL